MKVKSTLISESFTKLGIDWNSSHINSCSFCRYFLSNIVQMDLFKSFCQQTLFGKSEENESIASNIPLFKCDLYGSKRVGKKLK